MASGGPTRTSRSPRQSEDSRPPRSRSMPSRARPETSSITTRAPARRPRARSRHGTRRCARAARRRAGAGRATAGSRPPAARDRGRVLVAPRRGRLDRRADGDQLVGVGDQHRPAGEPADDVDPGPPARPAADQHERGVVVEPADRGPDRVERLEQRRGGALVGGHQDLLPAWRCGGGQGSCRRRRAGRACARRRGTGRPPPSRPARRRRGRGRATPRSGRRRACS